MAASVTRMAAAVSEMVGVGAERSTPRRVPRPRTMTIARATAAMTTPATKRRLVKTSVQLSTLKIDESPNRSR